MNTFLKDGVRLWIVQRRLFRLHRNCGLGLSKPLESTDPLGRCTSLKPWSGTMIFGKGVAELCRRKTSQHQMGEYHHLPSRKLGGLSLKNWQNQNPLLTSLMDMYNSWCHSLHVPPMKSPSKLSHQVKH